MASPSDSVSSLSTSGSRLSVESTLSISFSKQPVEQLLLSLNNVNSNSDFNGLYKKLDDYLVQFTEKQFEVLTKTDPLIKRKLIQNLLDYTPTLWEEQYKLVIKLAEWNLSAARQKKSFKERYPHFLQAMDYYSKAIRISEQKQSHQTRNDHLRASRLLIEVIIVYLVEENSFAEELDRYKREDKTSLFIDSFERVELLKKLCCTEDDRGIIQALYQQASTVFVMKPNPAFTECSRKAEQELAIEPYQFPLLELYPTEKYRSGLIQIRSFFEQLKNISTAKDLGLFEKELTDQVVKYFKVVLSDAFAIVGPPPCLYDFRAMGSLSREEFCPFSDIEYMILIQNENKQDYFKTLAQVFELFIRSLGETSTDTPVFTCIDRQNPSGFHIDSGGNPANDVTLILKPEEMAKIHKKSIEDPSTINNTSLFSIRLQSNDDGFSLFTQYKQKLNAILLEAGDQMPLRHKERALQMFSIRLADFKKAWSTPFHKHEVSLDVKSQFVCPLYILGDIALYFMISERNPLKIIDALVAQSILTKKCGKNIQKGIAAIYRIRSRLHINYQQQKDVGFFSEMKGCFLNSELVELENIYWQILVPLYYIVEKVVGPVEKPKGLLESNLLFDKIFKKLDFSLEYSVEHINDCLLMQNNVERSRPMSEVLEPSLNLIDLDPHHFSGLILFGLCLSPTCGFSEKFRVLNNKNNQYNIVKIEGIQFFSTRQRQRYIPFLFPQMKHNIDPGLCQQLLQTSPALLAMHWFAREKREVTICELEYVHNILQKIQEFLVVKPKATHWDLFRHISAPQAERYQYILASAGGDFFKAQKQLFEIPDGNYSQVDEENALVVLRRWINGIRFQEADDQEDFLEKVFTLFPEIKKLQLSNCLLNDQALHAIFKQPLQLQELSLNQFTKITSNGLIQLIRYNSCLRLVLGDNHALNQSDFTSIIRIVWELNGNIAIQLEKDIIDFEKNKLDQLLVDMLKRRNLFYARVLIVLGANVNQRSKSDETLLHVCAGFECPDMLEFLITRDVPIEGQEKSRKRTALHLAAAAGCMENLKVLAKKEILEIPDSNGSTALHCTLLNQKDKAAQFLILQGANILAVNKQNETICHIAIEKDLTEFIVMLLTNYPDAKSLLAVAENIDGRTPLHRAVWGVEKKEIVQILLNSGATVNTTNPSWGFTALHWAAKHGHKESAQLLLNRGADKEALNTLGATPIDLAIKHGQDEMIFFFLGVKTQIKACEEKDIEGHYYRSLIQAHIERRVADQIICLERLGDHYLMIKKDYPNSAKLFNCALAILQKERNVNSILEKFLLGKIERVEALFIDSLGIKVSPENRQKFLTFRAMLTESRKQIIEAHRKNTTSQIFLANLTKEYISLLRSLILDAQSLLGLPPVKWACIGMGSMSRYEMCLHSDLEFAFILDQETDQAMKYFRILSQFLELKIINLGETAYPVFGDKVASPTPNGFCMDRGGNTPFGQKDYYELIGNITRLANFTSTRWIRSNIVLANALSNVCYVVGDESLVLAFESKREEVLKQKISFFGDENRIELANLLLQGHLHVFSPDLSEEKQREKEFEIKRELYRPIQEILGCLSLLFSIKSKNSFDRINELVRCGIFSEKGAENLKRALSHVLSLRFEAHTFYKDEKESLHHLQEGEPRNSSLLYITEERINVLLEIYKVLLPFFECAKLFFNTKKKEVFSKSQFCDDRPVIKAYVFEKAFLYNKAKEAYQNSISLDPRNSDAYRGLGKINLVLGNYPEAVKNAQEALRILQTKCNDSDPDLAIANNNLALCFEKQGQYKEALQYAIKASKIWESAHGRNHPTISLSYITIGSIHYHLGNYQEALEIQKKALSLLKALGDEMSDAGKIVLARVHNQIGRSHRALGDLKKALESYKQALEIYSKALKGQNDEIAVVHHNLANVYLDMGDFAEALKSFKKAEEIILTLFGEEHPTLAHVYTGISALLEQRKEFAEALKYSQKALAIMIKVHKSKPHINIARGYHSVGCANLHMNNLKDALNNFKEAFLILCRCFEEEHPLMTDYLKSISLCISKLNDPQINKSLMDFFYPECERKFGKEHPFCELLRMLGENTVESLTEKLKKSISELGEENLDVAQTRVVIGSRLEFVEKYDEAIEQYQIALGIQEKFFGKNNALVAGTLYKIGIAKHGQQKYKEAMINIEQAFLIACDVYKAQGSAGSKRSMIEYLENLIVCYGYQKESVSNRIMDNIYPRCLEIFGLTHELSNKVLKLTLKLTLTDGFRG